MRLLFFFFRNLQSLYRGGNVALSKHVTHNDPRSVFLYYNLTTLHRECSFFLSVNTLTIFFVYILNNHVPNNNGASLQYLCLNILFKNNTALSNNPKDKPLVEQELKALPEHLGSPPVFSGVRVNPSLVYALWIVVCPFVLFLFVLSVLLWYTDSDYSLVSSNSSKAFYNSIM